MNDFKKKLNLNILIIVFIFAIGLLSYLYFTKIISDKTEEIKKLRNDLNLYTKSIVNLAKLKEISPQVDLYKSKLDLLIPNKDKLIDLPKWVSDVARANQVNVNFSFKPGGKDSDDKNPGFENFSIDVSGSLDNIQKFLYNIETVAPNFILNLSSFTLSQTDNEYRFSSTGKVFYIK
jgi:Tfp pilus assembly protein PilO